MISAFLAELKSHLFLFVPAHLSKYYELTLQSTITNAFPHASKEIVAAGNCLASGLFTASVFHSMRAAEIGLRVLGNELGVFFPDEPLELAEWQQILEQSESKIKAMKSLQPKQHREEELNFFSQSAVQFTYFKDAWRVRVAHARETYEENPAIRVFSHTLEFFDLSSIDDLCYRALKFFAAFINAKLPSGLESVNHKSEEYSRGQVSTNTVEGFFPYRNRPGNQNVP